jgi:hypothetical protein
MPVLRMGLRKGVFGPRIPIGGHPGRVDFGGSEIMIIIYIMEDIRKNLRTVRARQIAAVVLLAAVLVIAGGCQDTAVQGEYKNPYTLSEVQRMLAYHGARVARFDGHQWWFLSGGRWIRLENAGAYGYTMFSSEDTEPSTL